MNKEQLINYKNQMAKKYYEYVVLDDEALIDETCFFHIQKSLDNAKEASKNVEEILKKATEYYINEDYDELKLSIAFSIFASEEALDEEDYIVDPKYILPNYVKVDCLFANILKNGEYIADKYGVPILLEVSKLTDKNTFIVNFDEFFGHLLSQGYEFDDNIATFEGLKERAVNNYSMNSYITVDFSNKLERVRE